MSGMVAFVLDQQGKLGAFASALPLPARLEHAWHMIALSASATWHGLIMFDGQWPVTPESGWKVALLAGLPPLLWLAAEAARRASGLLRLLVALPPSFVAVSLLFGDRLGGHHFVTLVPLAYAAIGIGLADVAPAFGRHGLALAIVPVLALAGLNVVGQVQLSEELVRTRGRGFLSDAIQRLGDDLNATPRKPFLWFPDAVLALPLVLLTQASVPMTDQMDDPEPRQTLCAGRDVAMVRIPHHPSNARADQWQAQLGWDAPSVQPYRQADGAVVFEVLTFHGRTDGPGCATPATAMPAPR